MTIKKICSHRFFKIIIAAVVFVVVFIVGEAMYLHYVHGSFDRYYDFRGCVELIEKTDTYGTCRLKSGSVIKIVLYDNKWYLDGDLPYPGLNFL